MSDQTFRCVDCGREFIWSYGEQRYFRERKLEPPKRCPDCRSHRRYERESGTLEASARPSPARTKPRVSSTSTPPARSGAPDVSQWRAGWPDPYKFYGLILVFSTLIVGIILFNIVHDPFWSYLSSINLIAFLMCGFDKLAAKSKWLRVPENVLIAPVWALGFIGAEAGRRVFQHKTSDVQFRVKYWISVVITAIIIVAYVLRLYW